MKRTLALALLAGTFVTAQASAFSYSTCLGEKMKWNSNSKQLRISSTSFPNGYWRNGVEDGINRFNLNPSKFRYTTRTDTGGVSRGNGQSEIWGTSNGSSINDAPAVASYRTECFWFFGNHVKMKEVDIIFNYESPWRWTANTNKEAIWNYSSTGGLRPLQTTLAHELGHGLKLNHVNYEYNVMGRDWEHIHVNNSSARAYMGEDTADGVTFLYGARSGSWEDVGVVHWAYSGASGEYSDHRKTRIYNTSGSIRPTFTVTEPAGAQETGYTVRRGMQIDAEFSFENNGKTQRNGVATGFYISSNDYITTSDRKIGSWSLNLGRNAVYTAKKRLTIPNDLQVNRTYWLGAIVDDSRSISEAVEWNNATYIPIRVVP